MVAPVGVGLCAYALVARLAPLRLERRTELRTEEDLLPSPDELFVELRDPVEGETPESLVEGPGDE